MQQTQLRTSLLPVSPSTGEFSLWWGVNSQSPRLQICVILVAMKSVGGLIKGFGSHFSNAEGWGGKGFVCPKDSLALEALLRRKDVFVP